MRVVVDWNECVASGTCTSIAPSVFELSDDGELVLKHGAELDPSEVPAVEDAVACCPVEALSVTDDVISSRQSVAGT